MNKILFLLIIITFLVFTIPVLATITDVSTSASVTRATTGTNVVVSVTTTSSESDTADIRLIAPSEISISDPSAQYYPSVSVTGQVTKPFTITAGTSGTYSNIYGQATPTGQSPVSSTPITIVFEDPSALTVSGSPSSTTKSRSESFTLSITISNPQANDITTYYALTCPSEISCSGDLTSNTITVSSSSSTNLQWTATVSSLATAGAKTISFQLGDATNAFTTTVTVSVPSDSPGGSGAIIGGGPVTKVTVSKGNANITIPSIAANKTAVVSITKTEDVAFRQINISVANSVNNIKIVITKIPGLPASVTHEISGKIYHYIEINKENITDVNVNKIYIKFAVNKTWLTDNNVDALNIALYRWNNGQWNELETDYVSEDVSEVFYQAESPGFSYFLIGTKGGAPAAPTGAAIACKESWSCTGWSSCINNQQTRTCTDSNNCGTTVKKPAESQICEVGKAEFGITITSILTYLAIIVIAIVICVFIFLQRAKISGFLRSSNKSTKKKNKKGT
ncbi:MAG: PGF-pre-PGF domain-containing protein [Candidatus Aenigmarchaeota archaeon]|nr:PGF-pre-PGF domain-containing protein [Candidatus Aenigmarchaeota archaeon]